MSGDERPGCPTASRRVAVSGALGRMGATVCQAVQDAPDLVLVAVIDPRAVEDPATRRAAPEGHTAERPAVAAFGSVDDALDAVPVDVVVDFTRPESVLGNIRSCIRHGVPIAVGTSGLGADDLDEVARETGAAGGRVFIAPNFALGAVLMMQAAREVARHMHACEVVELHHDRKVDAPSGTARRTADLVEAAWRQEGIDRTVPIHSVRLPGLVAHQETIFGGVGETLTLRHDSLSRESFMPGVLLAIRRIDAVQGLVVGLENLL